MCIELNTEMEYTSNKKKSTYCIKKVLKAIFKHSSNKKKIQTATTLATSFTLMESLESLENLRNSQVEEHYEEIEENAANEKLLSCFYIDNQYSTNNFESNIKADDDEEEVFVPVRFARTDAGTFFWTTNLQPATIILPPQSNQDLINHVYCYNNTYPELQYQDRWAQA